MTVPYIPPGLPSQLTKVSISNENPGASFFKYFFLVLLIILVIFLKSYQRRKENDKLLAETQRILRPQLTSTGSRPSRSSVNPSHPDISKYQTIKISGLTLKFPRKPTEERLQIPPGFKEIISKHESWDASSPTVSLSVTYMSFRLFPGGLRGMTTGAIAAVKAEPGVTQFTSEVERLTVSGAGARRVKMNYREGRHQIAHEALIIVDFPNTWQIQVISKKSGDDENIKKISDLIFKSVVISK